MERNNTLKKSDLIWLIVRWVKP